MKIIKKLEKKLLQEYRNSAAFIIEGNKLTIMINFSSDFTNEVTRRLYEIIDPKFKHLMEETISDLRGKAFYDIEKAFNHPLKEIDWKNIGGSFITKKYIIGEK